MCCLLACVPCNLRRICHIILCQPRDILTHVRKPLTKYLHLLPCLRHDLLLLFLLRDRPLMRLLIGPPCLLLSLLLIIQLLLMRLCTHSKGRQGEREA